MQTTAVNAASLANYRKRYGTRFHRFLAELEANEQKSLDQLLDEQQQAVKRLLQYAIRHVPYYRELKLSPDRLQDWPVLDKQTVAAAPEKFL